MRDIDMADTERLKLHMQRPGDPRFERIMTVMGKMLAAAAWDQKSDDLDPAEHTHITMTAAAFAAGYLTGACIVAGTLNEGDKKRAGEAMMVTYRQGVRVGRDTAMASMPTEGAA
jgi:hypothetical protein